MTYYKILTHDFRPPLQRGEPIWDGVAFPHRLETVKVDTGPGECAYGWNCVSDLATGFRIASLWPTAWPSVALVVEPQGLVVTVGEKTRSSDMVLLRVVSTEEMTEALRNLVEPFGEHADVMAKEQALWREALSRPLHDPEKVRQALKVMLEVRELPWELREFSSIQDASAWADKGDYPSTTARDGAIWAAWNPGAVWDVWDYESAAWGLRSAWDAGTARAVWGIGAARAALMLKGAVLTGLRLGDPDFLTIGLRDAYRNGLEIIVPSGPKELGWVMA